MDETLARDWNWSQRFPMQPEVLEYFEYVDSKLDISKDYDFGTTVTQAVFDETNAAWNVSLSDGRLLLARWLVLGVGFSSKTRVPNIEGLQLFEGEIHHTGAWPESGGDVKGKKVAIVGTGTSAAQTIREIGPSVASLTVYQRDPAIALPLLPNDSVDPDPSLPQRGEGNGLFAAKALSTFTGINHAFLNPNAVPADSPTRQAYYNYLYEKGDWSLLYSNFEDMWTNESVSNDVYSVWAKRTRERIEDAAKCDLLVPETPNHPIGTKRVCLIDNYYETFNRPNVSLVDIVKEPLREITKTGIRSGEEHHDYDMIIFATGFQPLASGILAMNITGRSGMRLEDSWNKSSNSYLGMTVPGFPNMLYLNGPGSPTVGVNAPTVIEHQTQWMMTLLNFLRKSYISTFEATDAAAQGWRKELIKQWDASLFSSAIIMQNNNHASRGKEPTW
ncbi:FAD/NAD(P)-binding domain-containing protein [Penicillium samsonianum]|uniref:FAD/NAD(P)-binding domain-containing protein n=1 Tax=Penicillium samsonianum TaxID=1882272 RepID=UPI002548B685|nr:FAD/NAD(P)-binding domain-containing protein [Penicillium samsonianum]KAJ6118250.1 FAD/NAD(P)-binding domain-containing protein [Penicillium samsonianum]